MECPPGVEPAPSLAELYPLREIIEDAVEQVLTDRERWVFNAVVVERLSFRQLGTQLGLSKSHVHRLYQQACSKLAASLESDDTIQQYLRRE